MEKCKIHYMHSKILSANTTSLVSTIKLLIRLKHAEFTLMIQTGKSDARDITNITT